MKLPRWLVIILLSASVLVVFWIVWLIRPQRDETIRTALKTQTEPGFWWPPSWRAEFLRVRPIAEVIHTKTFYGLTKDALEHVKNERNAFWLINDTLRRGDREDRKQALLLWRICSFEYNKMRRENDEFIDALSKPAVGAFAFGQSRRPDAKSCVSTTQPG